MRQLTPSPYQRRQVRRNRQSKNIEKTQCRIGRVSIKKELDVPLVLSCNEAEEGQRAGSQEYIHSVLHTALSIAYQLVLVHSRLLLKMKGYSNKRKHDFEEER
jgi:hypothetical protein